MRRTREPYDGGAVMTILVLTALLIVAERAASWVAPRVIEFVIETWRRA